MKIQNIDLEWLGHDSFRIEACSKTIFIDPYQISSKEKADIILITHSHYDHCSQPDIEKIAKDGTVIICTADCQSKVTRLNQKIHLELVEPGTDIAIHSAPPRDRGG